MAAADTQVIGVATAGSRPAAASSPSTLSVAASLIAYRLLVDLGYNYVIAGPFAYWGFRGELSAGRLVTSWIFYLLLLPLLTRVMRSERLASQFGGLLSLISLVPTAALIAHDPRYPLAYIVLMFTYWLIFLLAIVYLPAIAIIRTRIRSEWPHIIATTVLAATVLYTSWRYTGFRLHFGLFDVYDIRVEARGFAVPAVLGYLGTFADNVLPILLAYYLRRGWRVVAAAVATVIVFNYGISGTKQVIFLLAFALVSILVPEPSRFNRRLALALGAVVGLAIVERAIFGTIILGNFSLYRVFAIPAHLHWVYYDYFQGKEFLQLTQSILKYFFESPYSDNIQFLVGEYDRGEYGGRANNGLFTDGYLNFGGASVIVFPLLCVLLLKMLESAAQGLSSGVRFIMVVCLSFVFLGLPLSTAFLSAGVAVLLLLLPTLPRLDGAVTEAVGSASVARGPVPGTGSSIPPLAPT